MIPRKPKLPAIMITGKKALRKNWTVPLNLSSCSLVRMEEKILGAFEGKSTEVRLANVPRIPQRETGGKHVPVYLYLVHPCIYIYCNIYPGYCKRERGN